MLVEFHLIAYLFHLTQMIPNEKIHFHHFFLSLLLFCDPPPSSCLFTYVRSRSMSFRFSSTRAQPTIPVILRTRCVSARSPWVNSHTCHSQPLRGLVKCQKVRKLDFIVITQRTESEWVRLYRLQIESNILPLFTTREFDNFSHPPPPTLSRWCQHCVYLLFLVQLETASLSLYDIFTICRRLERSYHALNPLNM